MNPEHIFKMNAIQWSFSYSQQEGLFFLQYHICSTVYEIFGNTVGNCPK